MRFSNAQKLVYLVIGVICLMLGVVGLIIPIIPGVLFLMAAVYLLSRGSKRIHEFTKNDPRLSKIHRRMDQFGEVDAKSRIQLAGWMVADAAATTVRIVGGGVHRANKMIKKTFNGSFQQ